MQKGKPPLLNEHERAVLLSAIEAVDRVVIFDEQDASSLIRSIQPETVVKGIHFHAHEADGEVTGHLKPESHFRQKDVA